MSNKKTEFKYFTIPQYRQEENYLSSMHEKGWKLTGITMPGLYHFEKCEPAKVTYRLDYNQDVLSVVFLVIAGLYLVLFAVMSFQFYQYEKFVSPENSGTLYKYAGIFTILLAIAVGIGFFFHFFNS